MCFYKEYLKERQGLETLEIDQGFATYKFRGPDCYIQDIYVRKEHRRIGLAFKLADKVAEIAKQSGVRLLTGSIDSRALGAVVSEQVLVAYGMKPYTKEGFMTYYIKELI